MRASSQQRRARRALLGYAFVMPSTVGILAFLIVPIGIVVWLSLQQWDMVAPIRFVGLDNWGSVLTDGRFGRSLLVTLAFVAVTIPVQTALGLAFGRLLSLRLPGSAAFRALLVIPWVCAPLTLGIVWKWVFAKTDGVLNAVLGTDVAWLAEPRFVFWVVCLVAVWTNVGYVSLFYASALQAIPQEILEAAAIDGAGPRQRFFRITLPLLRPTTFFVLVTSVISSFQIFDSVYALAPNGGPDGAADVVAGRIYYEAFSSFNLGRAAVMSIVVMLILVAVTIVQQRYFRRRTTYEVSS